MAGNNGVKPDPPKKIEELDPGADQAKKPIEPGPLAAAAAFDEEFCQEVSRIPFWMLAMAYDWDGFELSEIEATRAGRILKPIVDGYLGPWLAQHQYEALALIFFTSTTIGKLKAFKKYKGAKKPKAADAAAGEGGGGSEAGAMHPQALRDQQIMESIKNAK